jgi:type I restriction enzyme S subunit
MNKTIDLNKKIIEELKQAKQSLISEAVTGKIDLRDWEVKGDLNE